LVIGGWWLVISVQHSAFRIQHSAFRIHLHPFILHFTTLNLSPAKSKSPTTVGGVCARPPHAAPTTANSPIISNRFTNPISPLSF